MSSNRMGNQALRDMQRRFLAAGWSDQSTPTNLRNGKYVYRCPCGEHTHVFHTSLTGRNKDPRAIHNATSIIARCQRSIHNGQIRQIDGH